VYSPFLSYWIEAKTKLIWPIILDANGVRIAKNEAFVEHLASYMSKFQVYLQLDSFKKEVLEQMRGEDQQQTRIKAIENLNKYNLSTTLLGTRQKGQNTDEIVKYGEAEDVRGVTFQPVQVPGRLENFDPSTDRYTDKISLTKVVFSSQKI
jgi:uncharacterized radical SAM superfamily Fe-S cluster-containing enzyme